MLNKPKLGVKKATMASILRSVENRPQENTKSLVVVGKNIFSVLTAFVCSAMHVLKLNPTERARMYFGSILIPKIES